MSIGEVLNRAYSVLKKENIDTYILDSQLLLQKVLKKDKLFIVLNRDFKLSEDEELEYFKLIEFRRKKMPVKYILGECEFMGLDFNVREGVLIPRPDTEILVEEVLDRMKKEDYKSVCDVCCGSGAIGLSIGNYIGGAYVECYDISDAAIEVTKENINKLNLSDKVQVFKSDLLDKPIKENKLFDIVVSNPPYIRKEVIPTLMEDVKRYEPYIALCGGEDGLDFYRRITKQSLSILKKGGLLIFEIGYDQEKEVSSILEENGFLNIKCIRDLSGLPRTVLGTIF